MTDTKYTSVTALIEQRIRAQAEADALPAIAAFELTVEAAIKKLDVFAPMTPLHSLVRDVRTKHIDNLVKRRVDALVAHLVTDKRADATFDRAGERIIPRGPEPTATSSGAASVPAGATVILECDQKLTDEQREATEAHALSKLPAGCQVLVLDRGIKASVSIKAPKDVPRSVSLG